MNYANRKAQQLLHTPEGVRDCYGRENTARSRTIEKIAEQIHLYGYKDLQTPSFEYFDVFSRLPWQDAPPNTLWMKSVPFVSVIREALSRIHLTCRENARKHSRWAPNL